MALTAEKRKLALIETAKINYDEAKAELAKPIIKGDSVDVVLFLARINEAIVRLQDAEKLLLSVNSK